MEKVILATIFCVYSVLGYLIFGAQDEYNPIDPVKPKYISESQSDTNDPHPDSKDFWPPDMIPHPHLPPIPKKDDEMA